jgi:SAM-dependent methyltransferase
MHCAICGPQVPARLLMPATFSSADLDFTARKVPLGAHFTIVSCERCGLVYSNPIMPEDEMLQLYRDMEFINELQLQNMRNDYLKEFRAAVPHPENCGALLEIGCSSGFFLKAAKDLGVKKVVGVEPSRNAIAAAPQEIRGCIVNDTFRDGLFEPESFDIVCFFQVFDHIVDPGALLAGIKRVLRPNGLVIAIHHNIRSLFARCLGSKCPMYDVEHIYLFDLETSAALFRKHGFHVVKTANVTNQYALEYAVKMFPFPRFIKNALTRTLSAVGMSDFSVPAPAGNMISIARK